MDFNVYLSALPRRGPSLQALQLLDHVLDAGRARPRQLRRHRPLRLRRRRGDEVLPRALGGREGRSHWGPASAGVPQELGRHLG